jgi:hypothetical protein
MNILANVGHKNVCYNLCICSSLYYDIMNVCVKMIVIVLVIVL